MPLSSRDLARIRAIVREELARLHGASIQALEPPSRAKDEDGDDVTRENARAMLAYVRREPGSEERLVKADARYRLAHDDGYRERARKFHGKQPSDPLSVEEMEQAIREWRRRNKEAAAKARRTREAKRKP